jgi:hypothetical protein
MPVLLDAVHESDNQLTREAPLQDDPQADVKIGKQEKRGLTLERMRLVAVARVNTLLNRDPDVPLPPPPKTIALDDGLPDAPPWRATALARRPLRVENGIVRDLPAGRPAVPHPFEEAALTRRHVALPPLEQEAQRR